MSYWTQLTQYPMLTVLQKGYLIMGLTTLHNMATLKIHCPNMRHTVVPSTQVMHVCKAPLDGVDADMKTRHLDVVVDVAISEAG